MEKENKEEEEAIIEIEEYGPACGGVFVVSRRTIERAKKEVQYAAYSDLSSVIEYLGEAMGWDLAVRAAKGLAKLLLKKVPGAQFAYIAYNGWRDWRLEAVYPEEKVHEVLRMLRGWGYDPEFKPILADWLLYRHGYRLLKVKLGELYVVVAIAPSDC